MNRSRWTVSDWLNFNISWWSVETVRIFGEIDKTSFLRKDIVRVLHGKSGSSESVKNHMISPELDGYTKQCEITPTAFDQTMPVIYFKFISVSTNFSFQANLLLDEIPYHGYFLFSVFKFRFLCLRCLLFSQQHLLTGQGVRHLKILTCWYINWDTQEPIKERFSSQRGLVKNKHFPSAFSHLLTAINCRQFSLWKMRQINLIRKI